MNSVYPIPGLRRNIEPLPDDDLAALCEEPEFLIECTPFERELIARLGAALEAHSAIENELQAETFRLRQYEPKGVAKSRQKAARENLRAIVKEAERSPRVCVRVAQR